MLTGEGVPAARPCPPRPPAAQQGETLRATPLPRRLMCVCLGAWRRCVQKYVESQQKVGAQMQKITSQMQGLS